MHTIRIVLVALASVTTGYYLPHASEPSLIKFKRIISKPATVVFVAAHTPASIVTAAPPAALPRKPNTTVIDLRHAMVDNEKSLCEMQNDEAVTTCARLYDWLSWDDPDNAKTVAMTLWSKCLSENRPEACDWAETALQRSQLKSELIEVQQQGCRLSVTKLCYDAIWEMANQHASQADIFNFAKSACPNSDLSYCNDIDGLKYSPANFEILKGAEGKYGGRLIPLSVED